VVEKED